MIFILFVLLFLVAAKQYSTLKDPRTVSSFSFVRPSSRQQLVSSSFSRMVTPSLRPFTTSPARLVTTFLCSSSSSSSSSNPEKITALEKKIEALEHLMKGGNSTTASEDIRESVLIYEGSDKDFLRSMIKSLQEEKTALCQAAVGSKGTLRWTMC